ncbi:MAG TPA: hypothetical protein VKS24_06580 [Bradyrhizobium sp.]|nr:hypothetical protein [Bradyrhizobium sp.]
MTKKLAGLIAILVCPATVTSSENATAASATQTKTQMPATRPMPVTPPPAPKTNITQPVHVQKEFPLNVKLNSQGAVKGKSARETPTLINGATVITTKIRPSSLIDKVGLSPIDQVGAPVLDASSKAAAQMSVLKTFPPFSFDKFGAAGRASAASVTEPEEAGGAGKIILNSFSTRKSYAPPVWTPSDATGAPSVLRVDGARIEIVSGLNTTTINGARTENAGGSSQITPGATRTENVSSSTVTIGGARNENVGGSKGNAGQANDLSDSSALRLQMEMDDRSKLLQTLSDIEKSQKNTDNNAVKNIK